MSGVKWSRQANVGLVKCLPGDLLTCGQVGTQSTRFKYKITQTGWRSQEKYLICSKGLLENNNLNEEVKQMIENKSFPILQKK